MVNVSEKKYCLWNKNNHCEKVISRISFACDLPRILKPESVVSLVIVRVSLYSINYIFLEFKRYYFKQHTRSAVLHFKLKLFCLILICFRFDKLLLFPVIPL